MADIDLNRLLRNNQTYTISIRPPAQGQALLSAATGDVLIKGFLTNQLTWSAQNNWEGLHSGLRFMKDNADNVSKVETLTNQAGGSLGGDGGQHAMGGITETIARWQGAMKPTFGFNIMFVALDEQTANKIPQYVKTLLKGCLPSSASGEGWAKGTMEAPYGYKTGFTGGADDTVTDSEIGDFSDNSTTEGTWRVQVGRWFRAPKLVLNSCNVNFSQQCTPSGQPLFVECQLVFETWRLLKAHEVDSFFTVGRQLKQ